MLNLTSFGLGKYSEFFHDSESNNNTVRAKDIDLLIFREFGVPKNNYYLLYNGRKITDHDEVEEHNIVHVIPKILGGKGGFGSMLRAIGAQIEKTTNREACRDLSGRRLRDINEEQRLKNWIAQQAEREREAADRKKKRLEKLCREPKHDFKDDSYNQARSELAEKVSDSVEQGFKASTSGGTVVGIKRKESDPAKGSKKKKKKLWIDAEEGDTTSEESDSTENNSAKIIPSSKCLDTELLPDISLPADQMKNNPDVL